MSQTDQSHWRDPPKDRVDPDYPVNLTGRYSSIGLDGPGIVVYDEANASEAWIQCEGIEREAMV